jgi:hypothetical protein
MNSVHEWFSDNKEWIEFIAAGSRSVAADDHWHSCI